MQSTEVDCHNDWTIAMQDLSYDKIPQDLLDEFVGDILYCDNPQDSQGSACNGKSMAERTTSDFICFIIMLLLNLYH